MSNCGTHKNLGAILYENAKQAYIEMIDTPTQNTKKAFINASYPLSIPELTHLINDATNDLIGRNDGYNRHGVDIENQMNG